MALRVAILQRVLSDYRVAFFDALAVRLQQDGIELIVLAGQGRPTEHLKEPVVKRDYLRRVTNAYLAGRAYWMRDVFGFTRTQDLIVVEQANTALSAYALLLRRLLSHQPPRIAYWGHGRDYSKPDASGIPGKWKRFWTRKADFCFAYTAVAADAFRDAGVDEARMQIVNNASDTVALAAAVRDVTDADRQALALQLWPACETEPQQVGVFCSRLMPSKGIALLLNAALQVQQAHPGFRLLIVGDGPLRDDVATFCKRHPWCVQCGGIHGNERAALLSLADIWLNPGTAGLAITDAFACGIPFVTVDRYDHGPEIAYLDDTNSVVTDNSVHAFADGIEALIEDSRRLSALKAGALASGELYTIDIMADRFHDGIQRCLHGSTFTGGCV